MGEGDTRDVQFEKTIFDTQSKKKEIIFYLYLSEIRRILFVKMTTTNMQSDVVSNKRGQYITDKERKRIP